MKFRSDDFCLIVNPVRVEQKTYKGKMIKLLSKIPSSKIMWIVTEINGKEMSFGNTL